jgi:uncharacterized protein
VTGRQGWPVAAARLVALALGLVLGLAAAVGGAASSVWAAALADDSVSPASGLPLLVDGADLLDPATEASLAAQLGRISRERGADVVVLTVPSLGYRSATDFADDYFDAGPNPEDPLAPGSDWAAGYGQGSERSGVLLLVSLEDRDWALSTRGDSIDVFTDARQENIMDEILPWMSSGAWDQALTEFARLADNAYYQDARFKWEWVALGALVAGLLGGFVPVTIWKRQLKSVRPAVAAMPYLQTSSLSLTQSTDQMVRQYTSVVDHSPQSSGGGSSTHMGSSGAFHGGSSGKF